MSWSMDTPPCPCRCALPGISIESKTIEGSRAQIADFDFETIGWRRAASFYVHSGEAVVTGSLSYGPFASISSGTKSHVRVTYISTGAPVRLRLRVATCTGTDASPTYDVEDFFDGETTGVKGEMTTAWEGDVPVPSAPFSGVAYTYLTGQVGDSAVEFFLTKAAAATLSKQGFHAYTEEPGSIPVVYRKEMLTGSGVSGTQMWAGNDDFFTTMPTEPAALAALPSPSFPGWRVPLAGTVLSELVLHLPSHAQIPYTLSLSQEYGTEELMAAVEALLVAAEAAAPGDYPDLGTDYVESIHLQTRDETLYRHSRCLVGLLVLAVNVFSAAVPTVTLRWNKRTHHLRTGAVSDTEETRTLNFEFDDPIHFGLNTASNSEDVDPIELDAGLNQAVRLSNFRLDPIPTADYPIRLEHPEDEEDE